MVRPGFCFILSLWQHWHQSGTAKSLCVCVCVALLFLFIHVKGKKEKEKYTLQNTRVLPHTHTHRHTWQYQQWIYATVSGCVCVNLDLLPWRLIGVLVQRETSLLHKVPVCLVLFETFFSNDVLQERRSSKMVTPSLSFPCSWHWPLTFDVVDFPSWPLEFCHRRIQLDWLTLLEARD